MNTKSGPESMVQKYSQLHRDIKEDTENKLDMNGNSVKLQLANESEIYSKYSVAGGETVNEGILDYLERAIEHIPVNELVHINVSVLNGDKSVIEKLRVHINKNVRFRVAKINHEMKKNIRVCLGLAFGGLVLIAFQIFMSKHRNYNIMDQFLIIAYWVFISKTVELYFFERPKMKRAQIKLMQLYLAQYDEVQ